MQPSPLVQFTLNGLKNCYMPNHGRWSYKYHLDGRARPNESLISSDIFYSLNVLLGLSRTRDAALAAFGIPPEAMFQRIVAGLNVSRSRVYAYGMALWAAAELDAPLPFDVVAQIRQLTASPGAMRRWLAQDVGMMLSGAVAQARSDGNWIALAQNARNHIMTHLRGKSDLFCDSAFGARRHFASFATEVYCALSLYHYDELIGDDEAAEAADACAARLIALQGAQGEWPWFYHVASGRVLDIYEVYSVHQHGMAPALLKLAMRRGVPGARDALARGFRWVLGDNELGVAMLRPDISIMARSQARRGWRGRREVRLARAIFDGTTGRRARRVSRPDDLVITPEVRSYELGWTLWSFGDDADFPELTHHPAFSAAIREPQRFRMVVCS